MNRLVRPLGALLVVGVAAVLGAAVPGQSPPPAAPVSDHARVTVFCPAGAGDSFTSTVAGLTLTADLTRASLAAPDDAQPLTGPVTDSPVPILLRAPRSATFAGISSTRSSGGAERGLSLAPCGSARADQWFPGVSIAGGDQADLLLVNLDRSDAAVDVALIGSQGRIGAPGSRGIVVGAGSVRTVALTTLATDPAPVTVHLTASQGRVVALVRQRLWRGHQVVGAEWVAPAADPARTAVIPGLPAGKGRRDLVVVNPGSRTSAVRIDVLGTDGSIQLPGLETVDVPAGATRSVSLESGLQQAAAGLRLTAEQPITAAVVIGTSGGDRSSDLAVESAAVPLGPEGVWPVPVTPAARAIVFLTNAGAADAEAGVVAGPLPGVARTVTLRAGTTTMVQLPPGDVPQVRVSTSAPEVYASLSAKEILGQVSGLATLSLWPVQAQVSRPDLRYDPRAGG